MTLAQATLFAILGVTMALFVWGRWRYDLVAVLALLAGVFAGVIPVAHAFAGFGHPAVITVAAVLLISEALRASGVADRLVRFLAPTSRSMAVHVGAVGSMTALLSAFMNNIGALALMLPVILRHAYRAGRPASQVLMPLSFASLLGGLVTLIGTPPNIIIATIREDATGVPFAMFDFTPVGLAVAVVGVLFLALAGWRLLPSHTPAGESPGHLFQIEAYLTEARIPAGSSFIGEQVRAFEAACDGDLTVLAIIRGDRRRLAPASIEPLRQGDILILEGELAALEPLLDGKRLEPTDEHPVTAREIGSDDVRLVEAVLMPNSRIEGLSVRAVKMHERYGINLLAVARQGKAPITRLGNLRFQTGDVLLLQGERNSTGQALTALGCLPLADRGLSVRRPRRTLLPLLVFGLAVLTAALGILPIYMTFTAAAAVLVLANALSIHDLYNKIEWPVIVLLGALIPMGEAMRATGATDLIAELTIGVARGAPAWAMLALLIVVSMLLSDLIHNTPTAVIMAPIGISIAEQLGLPLDAFLMAIAVGAASPYLTPIGHQSNTLVMGPGGYRFGDYWRLGLPLDVLIVCVAVPAIMWVWM